MRRRQIEETEMSATAIAAQARSAARSASARKPTALASVVTAMARAFGVLHQPYSQALPTTPSHHPIVPTFIVYDVLDVIGAGRRLR
jgi:hypothetical protein